MTATISSWGNSQVLIEDNKIELEPIKQSIDKYDINELVNKLPNNYKAYKEFYNKRGLEEW